MATWKRILTTSDVTNNNIGSSNLFVEDNGDVTTRTLKLDTLSIFEVHNSSDQALLTLGSTSPTLGSVHATATTLRTSGALFDVRSSNTVNAEATNTFKIESINAANSHYPIFKLAKDVAGASVVDGYKGPKMAMTCASDNGTEKEVLSINSIVSDASNNVMSTEVDFAVRADNSMKTFMSAKGDGLHTKLEISDDNFIISSDQTGSSNSPDLILRKGDTGVADSENLGTIQFEGYNNASNPELVNYVSVRGEIDEIDDGDESGRFAVDVMVDGTSEEAFLINGDGLDISATLTSSVLRFKQIENTVNTGPTLELTKDRTFGNAPSADDLIGRVVFAGENENNAFTHYANIQAKIVDPTVQDTDGDGEVDGVDGRLSFSVARDGTMTEVIGVTHNGNGAATVELTANEQKLKGVEVHTVDLEQLTRRTLYNLHASSATNFSSATVAENNLDLGAIAITPALGTLDGGVYNYSETHGFVVPFDSFLTSATFAYKNVSSDGVDGHAALKVYIVKADGSASEAHTMSSSASHANNDDDFRHSVHSLASNSIRSVSVSAGDKIVPSIVVTKNSGGSNYTVTDVVADIYFYTESAGL